MCWEKQGRFYDALRPTVEPRGLASPEAVMAHREHHLGKVKTVLSTADVFIFTFGLTEAWACRRSGTVYPTAPGTVAGTYDPAAVVFKNFTYSEVIADFLAFREIVRSVNPQVKFVTTVSPVPLTATKTENHVLVATNYSKAVLRAVAGELTDTYDDIDYFPSYEIIAGVQARGFFYESNLRSVNDEGVNVVMRSFFAEHRDPAGQDDREGTGRSVAFARSVRRRRNREDVVCEERLLEAFAT